MPKISNNFRRECFAEVKLSAVIWAIGSGGIIVSLWNTDTNLLTIFAYVGMFTGLVALLTLFGLIPSLVGWAAVKIRGGENKSEDRQKIRSSFRVERNGD